MMMTVDVICPCNGISFLLCIFLGLRYNVDFVNSVAVEGCPTKVCQCENGQIDCRFRRPGPGGDVPLQDVPQFTESIADFRELLLPDNDITSIQDHAFSALRIEVLNLKGNPLVSFASQAFSGVNAYLKELSFSLNEGGTFPSESFHTLTRLTNLFVSGEKGFKMQNGLPPGALKNLSNLTTLKITESHLHSLSSADFIDQQNTLKHLDLSCNTFKDVPVSAFANLTQLRSLKMHKNDLSTIQTRDSFKTLIHIDILDLSSNMISHIDGWFDDMEQLQELNLASNVISTLNKNHFRGVRNTLRILHLESNSLLHELSVDTFTELQTLSELYLDGVPGTVHLTSRSFDSLRTTLMTLWMEKSHPSLPSWSIFENMPALVMLNVAGCGLGNIPDFTFQSTTRLAELNGNDNNMTSLSINSLAGLEESLMILHLKFNHIMTLDRCSLGRMVQLNTFKLYLTKNPLQCDCSLSWLSQLSFSLQNDPWDCANLNRTISSEYEKIEIVGSNCDPAPTEACVNWRANFTNPSTSTTNDDTAVTPKPASLAMAAAIGGAAAAALVVIIFIIFCCICSRQRQVPVTSRKAIVKETAAEVPQLGGGTKRFIKQKEDTMELSLMASPITLRTKSVADHLNATLTEGERRRLINGLILSCSMASLSDDRSFRSVTLPHGAGGGRGSSWAYRSSDHIDKLRSQYSVERRLHGRPSQDDKQEYAEIADDEDYDVIPVDETA